MKKGLPWKEIVDQFKKEFCTEDTDCKGQILTELKALRDKKVQEFTDKEFKAFSNLKG